MSSVNSKAHEFIHVIWPSGPTGMVAGSVATALCWLTHLRIAAVFADICFVLFGTAAAATAADAVSRNLRTLVAGKVWS